MAAQALERELGSSASGLSAAEAAARLERHGPNELREPPGVPWWRRLVRQFRQLVILILCGAAVLSLFLHEWIDAVAILAIVVLNACIGFFQEARAERTVRALKGLAVPMARVVRDGAVRSVAARELVPGDRIQVESGDKVPADARLVSGSSLRVQEAALTGESVPVDKDAGAELAAETALGDRRNMIFLGTSVAAGKGDAVVVATGMRTELGGIAKLLEPDAAKPTPLEVRLAQMGRVLAAGCLGIVGVVFALELVRSGELLPALLIAVGLAVASVPEGLPAVVTLCLTVGLQRLARRSALVRRLPAVETLGCVTVICSDKTGTLTRNEMTVREVYAGGAAYEVEGAGYAPEGTFRRREPAPVQDVEPRREQDLMHLLAIAARCNGARLECPSPGEPWRVIGDPTEGALLVAAAKAGLTDPAVAGAVVHEIPFSSERKAMSVVVARDGRKVLYTKGAPEALLPRCTRERRQGREEPMADARRGEILAASSAMASRALRVLALAYRPLDAAFDPGSAEQDLIFAGLAGMMDPPREEAKAAVDRCRAAGIRPLLITGDHPETALAVARELRIAEGAAGVVAGDRLDGASDEELVQLLEGTAVFARVTAAHKHRLVRALRAQGHVVGMTGDGVNDAPALAAADIGIAMGRTGTDVTREAAAIVLLDDNFATIVNAVEEGRGIYDNIQKFVRYLLTCNLSEVMLMLVAAALGWPPPLTATQLVWINLVTDGLPALALGLEPAEPGTMQRAPRAAREPLIGWRTGWTLALEGSLIAIAAAAGFLWTHGDDPAALPAARSVAFSVIALAQLLLAMAARSRRATCIELGARTNPWLLGALAIGILLQLGAVMVPPARAAFDTTPLSPGLWAMILGLSAVPFTVVELAKVVRRKMPLEQAGRR